MRPPRKTYNNLLVGFRALQEAIDAGKEIDKTLIQKGLQGQLYHATLKMLKEHNIPWQMVPVEKLNQLTRANHQGVIAFTSPITFDNLEETVSAIFESGRTPALLMLDGVTDVRNFGAICRTAECQGFDAVIIPEKGAAQVNEDAVKTSAGAIFNLPICRVPSLLRALDYLKNSGIHTIACSEKTNHRMQDSNLKLPACIIMGSEETGISAEILKKVDDISMIPMRGKTSSMNVSVSAGIAMYELMRQRSEDINL